MRVAFEDTVKCGGGEMRIDMAEHDGLLSIKFQFG